MKAFWFALALCSVPAFGAKPFSNCGRSVEEQVISPHLLTIILTAKFPGIEDWQALYEIEKDNPNAFARAAAHRLLEANPNENFGDLDPLSHKHLLEAQALVRLYDRESVAAEFPLYLVLSTLEMERTQSNVSYPSSWLRNRVASRFTRDWKSVALQTEPEEHENGSEVARSKIFSRDGITKHNVRPLRRQDVQASSTSPR